MDKIHQNRQRELIQSEAERLSLKHKHLLITWSTGCGKGRAVMRCISASFSYKPWLVVVPEVLQIENFKNDLKKHGFDNLLDGKIADIICYASLDKYKGTSYNLALNEVHRLSENKAEIVKTINFDQIVSDSATVPSKVSGRLREIQSFYEYHISLSDAIDFGILPQPKIYTIGVDLDDVHKTEILKKTYGKKGTFERKVTQVGYLMEIEKDIKYWKEKAREKNWPVWIKNKMNQLALMRKKFLAECKTKAAEELILDLGDKRYICFTGSIEQSNYLGGDHSVHSKRTASYNKKIMNQFNEFEINNIFVNKMMREGINLEGIEAGIIIQLDSGSEDDGLSFFQMTGRSLRALIPEVYIFYIKNTQDQVYLERALENIDKSYIIQYETSSN